MATILLSGASGYVGRCFAVRARAAGHAVIALGRADQPGGPSFPWRLGEIPPADALHAADVLVHAAQDWRDPQANIASSLALAAAMPGRFVFVSSVSAHARARNAYGRAKLETEQRLRAGYAGKVVIARLGLVYGGEASGQYALMRKLAALLPMLPLPGLHRPVQPIHVEEAADGLLVLATRKATAQDVFVLAGPAPLRFDKWLALLRLEQTGRRLFTMPMPLGLALVSAAMLNALPFGPKVDRERILGLMSTVFTSSRGDLRRLALPVVSPSWHLLGPARARRAFLEEAQVVLHYLSGRKPTRAALMRLARALAANAETPIRFNLVIRARPALLRLIDPVQPHPENALGRHLHYAALVTEASVGKSVRPAPFAALVLEVLLLPLRLVLGWS